ncbi:MAG: class I SAM-dependent methyltransferase [Oligoflexia bacterium]|nr:class I SAM-dependent methyltransferase [Oligoflexia bacterium]
MNNENKIYHLQSNEDFFLRILHPFRGSVLELCCGRGELTIPLALAGIDIVGVEKNNDELSIAKLKLAEEKINIPFVQADIFNFDFGKKFSTIILHIDNLNNNQNERSSFSSKANVEKFTDNIKKNLEIDGQFIVEIRATFNLNPFMSCKEFILKNKNILIISNNTNTNNLHIHNTKNLQWQDRNKYEVCIFDVR